MQEVQTFTVDVSLSLTRRFRIDARTGEEAESIAEQFISDGEQGELTTQQIESVEAIPEEDLEVEVVQ